MSIQQEHREHSKYRGVSTVKPIDEAKRLVPVIDCADRLVADRGGRWRKVGGEWVTNCVLPDHPDKTPSFTVNPEKNVWWCFGCLRGGDVVELYRLANDYSQREAGTAAGFLLLEFGYEPTPKPDSWHRKQSRQEKIRAQIDREKVEHIRLLVFRIIWMPWLNRLPEFVRQQAAESAWEMSRSMALSMYERRRWA